MKNPNLKSIIMQKIFVLIFLIFTLPSSAFAQGASAKTPISIFAGDKKASFFAAASSICKVFNKHYTKEGYQCVAFESKGSEKNLHSLAEEEADFAIVKTPELNRIFVKNFSDLENKIDFVAQIHDEYLTILVQKKLHIKSLNDLNNRLINVGSIGSTSALVVQKYFFHFGIKPKKIVNFGATESFKMMCDKEIDAWIYFIGHPNAGFAEVLDKCDVEIISLPKSEIKNFTKIAPFLKETEISEELYRSLGKNINTVSTNTILAARKGINPEIKELMRSVFTDYKSELIADNLLFQKL